VVPRAIWREAEPLQAALDYLGTKLSIVLTFDHEQYHLIKSALFVFEQTHTGETMADALRFVRETLCVQDELLARGFDAMSVRSYMMHRAPDLTESIRWLSLSRDQQEAEYCAHESSHVTTHV
jgi:hypothetical protein